MKKYQQIFIKLQEKIKDQSYPEGSFLPTEFELVEQYQVSRDTIRKALTELAKEGWIRRRQGQGSQVVKRQQFQFPVSQLTSYQELTKSLGLDSKTNVISIDFLMVDDELARLTGFKKGQTVWRVIRQRIVDQVASVLDIDYLLRDYCLEMTRSIAEQSIYHYLENQLHLTIDYAEKQITIETLTDQDKLLLDVGSDKHVVSVKSKVYLDNGQQFQFTDSRHKLDKFTFNDFAKRSH